MFLVLLQCFFSLYGLVQVAVQDTYVKFCLIKQEKKAINFSFSLLDYYSFFSWQFLLILLKYKKRRWILAKRDLYLPIVCRFHMPVFQYLSVTTYLLKWNVPGKWCRKNVCQREGRMNIRKRKMLIVLSETKNLFGLLRYFVYSS